MKRFACLLPCLCLAVPLVRAQTTNATISGGVIDAAGRFVPDVDIDIANDETGIIHSVKTNSSGIYFVPILPPGHYHVQVSKPGFKTLIKPDVVLTVQSAVSLNFTLPVGARSESITVDASSSILNTTDASVSTVIDRKFVENIPLNGRSFQDLIAMTPGVTTQSPQSSPGVGGSGDFSVNGQRTESNYYTVDGVSANGSAGFANGGPQAATSGSVGSSTALGTTQSLISVDALQEFRVSSSTYSAEYGRSPGGQFSLVTRSGTKMFHGTAYDYLRNSYFDANNWFNDFYETPISALRQNDFGGTLGGPIFLGRGFSSKYPTNFFFSYEGLRLTQPQAASLQYVPSLAMRRAAPAALQPILNAFPLPTPGTAAFSSGLAGFIQGFSLPSKIDSSSVRFDQTLSPRHHVFFRIGITPSSLSTRSLSALTTSSYNTETYTVGLTSQLSDHSTNDVRVGYSRSDSSTNARLDAFGGATPVDLNAALGNGTGGNATSAFELSFAGTGSTQLLVTTEANQSRQWNLVDTYSHVLKKHLLKLGFDYRYIKSPLHPESPLITGVYLSEATVLANQADIGLLAKVLPATPIFHETAAFVQDEWRVSSSLTLSGGLRWEVNPPPKDQHGMDAFTLTGNLAVPSTLAVAPRGTPLWKTSWYNVAPRLGAAWTAQRSSGWETVLRGGGGVFFDTGNQVAATGFQYLGFSAILSEPSLAFPLTPAQLAFAPSTTAPYTSTNVIAFPEHLQAPYTLQWNVSVQQSLGKDQAFTMSYLGANGRRLLQFQEQSLGKLNPNFGTVEVVTTGSTSNYQALQLQLQRSVQHGLQVLASYTWSHAIDFGSTNSALPLLRGNADFDVRSNFQGGMTWEIPNATRNTMLRPLSSGWALDGRLMTRTAFPITLRGNLLTNAATGETFYGNLNLVQGQPIYRYGSQYPGGRALNRAAFQTPVAGNPGNAPRNFVRGFGSTQVNLAAHKTFPLVKDLSLMFRAEAFNVLNHPIFGFVDSTLNDALFGQATQTLNQSLSNMSAQYQQGGPRSLQFALKLQF